MTPAIRESGSLAALGRRVALQPDSRAGQPSGARRPVGGRNPLMATYALIRTIFASAGFSFGCFFTGCACLANERWRLVSSVVAGEQVVLEG